LRATLDTALAAGVLSPRGAQALSGFAQALFFKDRHWSTLLEHESLAAEADPQAFSRWLKDNRVDQKRRDALALVAAMRARVAAGAQFKAVFEFQETAHWQRLMERWR
jgi:hypothetical protein